MDRTVGPTGPHRLSPPPNYGIAHYSSIFDKASLGEAVNRSPAAHKAAAKKLLELMDEASVSHSVVTAVPREHVGAVAHLGGDRLTVLVSVSPHDGMRGVAEFERCVREEGAGGLSVVGMNDLLPASDRRYYPFYAKSVELGVPVRVYTAMTLANDRPYDLGHPRHVDQVATDFPELRLMMAEGGWPWVPDAIGILRRHPNVFMDTSSHRPKYFAQNGSGWDLLIQYGNTLLKNKIVAGFSSVVFGLTRQRVIEEYLNLPLKDEVKNMWLGENAAAFYGIR
jgi:predicted TIM-barrel fold metal-dependent hydrolase